MKRITLSTLATAAGLLACGSADASIILFDDAPKNGAKYWAAGGSSSGPTEAGDPVYSGDTAIRIRQGSWSQGGLEGIGSVPAAYPILQLQYYRPSGSVGIFMLRHGGNWNTLELRDTGANDNSDHWTIDGAHGYANNTPDAWHTLRIDVAALGLASLNAIGTGGSDGDDYWYFDDVAWVAIPEPASVALLGVGALALGLRRR